MMLKLTLWGVLVALFAVCGCEAKAATIPTFTLVVPSREHACNDTTTAEVDFDPVTVNVSARNSWATIVKTYYQIRRDSPFPVDISTPAGAAGYYQVQWRVSEPGGIIGCWSSQVGMIAFGW